MGIYIDPNHDPSDGVCGCLIMAAIAFAIAIAGR